MRILGIDPGTVTVGFGCVELTERQDAPRGRTPSVAVPAPVHDARPPLAHRTANAMAAPGRGGAVRLVDAGALRLSAKAPIEQRLGTLAELAAALFARLQPDELALEQAFFGRSVQAALRIGEARGVILAAACRHGLIVHQFPPARVKRVVAGHGGASKEAVAEMARRLLALAAAPTPRDASDALAIALCRLEERRTFAPLACNSYRLPIEYGAASPRRSRRCRSHTSEALEHRAGEDSPGETAERDGRGREPDGPGAAPPA